MRDSSSDSDSRQDMRDSSSDSDSRQDMRDSSSDSDSRQDMPDFDYGELLLVQHDPHNGPGALAPLLDARAHRRPWRVVDVGAGMPFPSLDDTRGILLLGGPVHVDDELLASLGREVNRLQEAIVRDIPLFGVGLGAQLMAVACDGEVHRRSDPRIGYFPLHRTEAAREDTVFAGWPDGAVATFLHDEEVRRLPDDADPMLTLDDSVVAWRAADGRSYGVDFHPEASAAELSAWSRLEQTREHFSRAGVDPEGFAAEGERRDRFLRAAGVSLLGRWVDEVVGAGDPDPTRGRRARA